jgi:hypothetical protein
MQTLIWIFFNKLPTQVSPSQNLSIFPIIGFLGPTNPKDCWLTNWNWKDLFFSKDMYKLEKMLFTIKKFREIDIWEQNWPNDF